MRTGSRQRPVQRQPPPGICLVSVLAALPWLDGCGSAQIIEAARYGRSHQTVSLQARLLALANAAFPRLTAAAMKIANRLLPRFNDTHGYIARPGWESQSPLSPSILTAPIDVAAERNNELGGRDPIL
jgi:hypothetical protein